ncbi:hypothetical protein EVAR_79088_1 [Eumeta japonica]|uniref:Uncharacterized protein n=1 Tax=Eumeta variegata TaxID=151549 RepID=A0A4C1X1V4_EUMVA|nr:hypothetical protein EVAR_79088_1 [Eumeta japonica]
MIGTTENGPKSPTDPVPLTVLAVMATRGKNPRVLRIPDFESMATVPDDSNYTAFPCSLLKGGDVKSTSPPTRLIIDDAMTVSLSACAYAPISHRPQSEVTLYGKYSPISGAGRGRR